MAECSDIYTFVYRWRNIKWTQHCNTDVSGQWSSSFVFHIKSESSNFRPSNNYDIHCDPASRIPQDCWFELNLQEHEIIALI